MNPILDVSTWQPNIVYSMASKDISGAIIRIGGTGYGSAHSVYDDDCFEKHYAGFKKAGVPLGAYFYAGAVTDAQVDAELQLCSVMLKGKAFEMPIYYDIEVPQGDHVYLSAREKTRLAKRFVDGIKKMGYKAGVYTFVSYAESKLIMDEFDDDTSIWIAQYNYCLQYNKRCDLWQYTSSGVVRGINGNVDLSSVKNTSLIVPAEEPKTEPEPVPEKKEDSVDSVRAVRVKEAQRWLNEYLGASIAVDGIFGSETNTACIKALQKYCGVDRDGIIGNQTRSACRVAEYGDETQLVSILQCALSRWGYTTVIRDGIFGQKTLSAVQAFQTRKGLSVDGKAGAQTFEALLS